MRRPSTLALALLLLAPAARATPFTLTLDPDQSSLTVRNDFSGDPELGPVPLSGTITFDVTGLPSGSFTLTQLDAAGAGGVAVGNASGSGLHGFGALVFTSPLLAEVTAPPFGFDGGFPPPIGFLMPSAANTHIAFAGFAAEFQLDGTRTLRLEIYAVPEPGPLAALLLAGAAAACAASLSPPRLPRPQP